MDATLGKEKKRYGLAPARTPQAHLSLGGVVEVIQPQGRGYAFIHFAEPLVTALAEVLPGGLSPENPAYLRVVHNERLGTWAVFAYSRATEHGAFLWETTARPVWLAKIKIGEFNGR